MRNKEREIELKVGIFLTVGMGLVMLAILVLGGSNNLFIRNNHYYSYYPSVEGLIPGAKVVLAGLQVGTVDSVDFDPETKDIKVSMTVARKYEDWIREDTKSEIVTQGVLGDKYVSLSTGTRDQPLIPSGGKIESHQGKGLTEVLSKSEQLMSSLTSISQSLDKILENFRSGNRSDIFFQGMATTSKNLAQITARLQNAAGNLTAITEKINNGTGTIGALVNDPSLYYDLKALTGGANRNRIIRNLVRQTIKDGEENAAPGTSGGEQAPDSKK